MAKKKSESPEKTTVRRIKAVDDSAATKKTKTATKTKATNTKKPAAKKTVAKAKLVKAVVPAEGELVEPSRNPFKALGGYFKGAWIELKQVRWPTRGATWSMTLAVLLFTGFFVLLIILLDTGFKWLFEQILR